MQNARNKKAFDPTTDTTSSDEWLRFVIIDHLKYMYVLT